MSPDDLVSAQFTALENGDAALAARCLHPEHVNHMAVDEPPACARPGVPGFLATSAWLSGQARRAVARAIEAADRAAAADPQAARYSPSSGPA